MRRVYEILHSRYHSNCADINRRLSRLCQALCTDAAFAERTTLNVHPFGSEVMGHWKNSAVSSHQPLTLSGFVNPTVFVTAFEILTTLYHVFPKKSNVFIVKNPLFFCTAFVQFYKGKKTDYQELTKRTVCDLMTSVHITKTLTENSFLQRSSREPAVGASRCGQLKQSDSRVGSVNERPLQ